MWKLIRGILVVLLAAVLILFVLSYFEQHNGLDFPASEILRDIKTEGQKLLESVNGFLESTGLKKSAANVLEKGADMLRATPTPAEPSPSPKGAV